MSSEYADTDLVYVDPALRSIVSKVQFDASGNVVPLEMQEKKEEKKEDSKKETKRRRKGEKKRYYPWGSYATMKKMYRIEGKQKETENYIELDEAIQKALAEPYW